MDNNITLEDLKREAEAAESKDQAQPQGDAGYAKPQMEGIPTQELLFPAIRLVMDVVAPSWNVTDKECASLAEAYGAVLDKYFPDGLGAYGVEINAMLITVIVFAPRMKTPRRPITVVPEPETPSAQQTPTH